MFACSPSCLLPPEGRHPLDDLNPPPQVDLEALRPLTPITDVGRACTSFRVEAAGIVDQNDGRLLLRWVANNRLPSVRHIQDLVSETAPGVPRNAVLRVDPVADFPEQHDQSATRPSSGVLSLFITDAPDWADPEPDTSGGQAQDLGSIEQPVDGPRAEVIELRWTFTLRNEPVGCP